MAVAMMQVREPPPPLPDVVPEHVRALIDAILVKDPARRYGTGGELAVAVAAVRRGDPLPIPGIPVQGGSVPRSMAIDETGETVYPPRSAPESPSGSVSVPAPSMSPISSPGMTPARPPIPRRTRSRARPSRSRPGPSLCAPTSRRSRRSGSHRSDASTPRPVVAHHAPTEPLRIPPARGPGRGLLLVLFVLLTLAAVALGVFLLRGGLSDLTGAAAASAVAVVRFAGSLASAPPDTVRNRHR